MSNQKKDKASHFSVSARPKDNAPDASQSESLDQLLGEIAAQIERADKHHTDILKGMHKSVQDLGERAKETEPAVPEDMTPAFERLQEGLNDLAVQIAQSASSDESAMDQDRTQISKDGQPAHASQDQSDPNNPWDQDSADALLDVYESADGPYALRAMHASMVASSNADRAWLEEKLNGLEEHINVALARARQDMGSQSERAWLEEKFSEIATKVEQSLGEMSKGDALEGLRERFSEFQVEVSDAIQGIALRSDMEGLKAVEDQIDSLKSHLEQVQERFERIDTMETTLSTIMDRVSDERLTEILGSSLPEDYVELATTAAEDAAQRMLASGPEGDMPGSNLDSVLESLEAFKEERRKADDQTASTLDTMQLAMINVLDRMELMENSGDTTNLPKDSPPETPAPVAKSHATLPDPIPASEPKRFQPSVDAEAEALGFEPINDHDLESEFARDLNEFEELVNAPESDFGNPLPATETADAVEPQSEVADPPQAAEPQEETDLSNLNAIERIRQEFVAEAQRARDIASRDSAEASAKETLDALSEEFEGQPANAAPTTNPRKQFSDIELRTPTTEPKTQASETSLFGISRRKLLIGAIILIIATSGLLFLMPRKQSTSSQAPSQQKELTAQPRSEGAGSQAGPGNGGTRAPAGSESNGQGQGPGEPGSNATPKNQGGQQNSSGLFQDGFQKTDDPFKSARFDPMQLEGVAIHNSAQPRSPRVLKVHAMRQNMANLSMQLGSAAAKATPAALLPELQENKNNLTANAAAITGQGKKQIDLPPATVGPFSLRLAAANGDPSAQFEVAARLASGRGGNQDFDSAANWYQRSASQGFAQSQYRLGTFYERGLGLAKDEARARIWYMRAAEQGNIKAMHNLAVLSASSSAGSPDYTTAAQWFQKAAERGLADSQFNLAVLHENGLGASQDLKQAYKYYALASKSGDKDAAARLAAIKAKLNPDEFISAQKALLSFRAKPVNKLVNDPRYAGQVWKNRANAKY